MDGESVIPEIDIGPLVTESSSIADQERVLHQIDDACRNIGFMSVVNHGVSMELIERMEKTSKQFFYLPKETKMSIASKQFNSENTHVYRGYIPATVFGKECLDMADPLHKECEKPINHLYESSKFPSELPAESKAMFDEYYEALHGLSITLIESVFRIFNADFADVEKITKRPGMPTLRLNYYPQHEEGYSESEVSNQDGVKLACETHTDSGIFTVLYQDEIGGLQVQDPKTKQWHDVPCNRKAFVINTGLAMQMLTNDRYMATFHRVKLGDVERLSIPFFYSGTFEANIDPTVLLPGEEPKYPVITYMQHALNRNKMFKEYQRD